jgi:hypothetical protein
MATNLKQLLRVLQCSYSFSPFKRAADVNVLVQCHQHRNNTCTEVQGKGAALVT